MADLEYPLLKKNITVGIDASSIIAGGGMTHIVEILKNFNPKNHSIKSIIIWSNDKVLSNLPNEEWLIKKTSKQLNAGFIKRTLWQMFFLGRSLQQTKCDILLCLGGISFTRFKPIIQMNQNLLPFEWDELIKYKSKIMFLRLLILRALFLFSFRRANGIIFLSSYSKNKVLGFMPSYSGSFSIIPHGVNKKFDISIKNQRSISNYSVKNPYKIIYVSTIDIYKNQINLIKSVNLLRKKEYPITLNLIGSKYVSYFTRLENIRKKVDPNSQWINYTGSIEYSELHKIYQGADMALYPSRCESFGLTLLEKMFAGLPICCSKVGTLPEIIQDGGLFFDSNDVGHMASQIERLILSKKLRTKIIKRSKNIASSFSWDKCSNNTFSYLLKNAREG